jgi:hypothetical protein
MKKLHFSCLYLIHKIMQFVGLKDKNNHVIKIWYDFKTKDTCLYLDGRSGLWFMPAAMKSDDKLKYESHWLASPTMMREYGLLTDKKKLTIYTLWNIVDASGSQPS